MRKISEWLSDFDGHSAVDAAMAREAFEKETGEEWPAYLKGSPVGQALKAGRKDPKGLQEWNGKPDAFILAGYSIARSLADIHANGFRSQCLGRGSEFRDCVEALRKAGK